MKKTAFFLSSLVAISAIMGGCSATGDSDGNSEGTMVVINDEQSAINALNSVSAINQFDLNLSNPSLPGSATSSKRTAALRTPTNSDAASLSDLAMACSNSDGYISIDNSQEDVNPLYLYAQFDNCAISGFDFGDVAPELPNFSDLYLNGRISFEGSFEDSRSLVDLKIDSFTATSSQMRIYLNVNANFQAYGNSDTANVHMKLDGRAEYETYHPYSKLTYAYENFTFDMQDNAAEINGVTKVTSTEDACLNGTYEYESITPIKVDNNGKFQEGTLRINNAIYEFKGDDLYLQIEGQPSKKIDQYQGRETHCQ